jgi:hypothetical protein
MEKAQLSPGRNGYAVSYKERPMITLSPRWRAAGSAALFVLVTWACNCGTFQQFTSPGGEVQQSPEAATVAAEAPTLPPPTEAATLPPAPEPTEVPPTQAPAATPTETGVLLEDDFSDPGTGWYVDDDPGQGSYAYENGVYAITALSSGLQMWGNANRSFGDVVITVDATQISAPANNNNAYGVGCRIQPGTNGDGYFLRISGDGYYAIVKYVTTDPQTDDGEFVVLVDWMPTDAVNQGNATNHIEVSCAGSELSLSVNGQFLGSAQDTDYVTGDIAMTATTFEDMPTTIHYDNVVVRTP